MGEADIIAALENQAPIMKAVRLRKQWSGRRFSETSSVLLVFGNDVEELPKELRIKYQSFIVHEFMPKPTRCYKCQAFGHTHLGCKIKGEYCPR